MDDSIKKKMGELEEKKAEAEKILVLQKEFPDLRITYDRWRNARYVSKSVNARATEITLGFNCGCCPDSPLEARPYIETMGTKIFADPDSYCVGDRYDGDDDYRSVIAYTGWKDALNKHNISQQVMDKVENHLQHRAPKDYPYEYTERKPKRELECRPLVRARVASRIKT